MNIEALSTRLRDEGFSPDVYRLDGSDPPYEGLILSRRRTAWVIEYCERGLRTELARLPDEVQACSRMYALLLAKFSPATYR